MNTEFFRLLRKGLVGLATATLVIASQSCAKKTKEAEIGDAEQRLARLGSPALFKDPRMFLLGKNYGSCTALLDPLTTWQGEFTKFFASLKSSSDYYVYHTWILRDGPAITVRFGSNSLSDDVEINFGPTTKGIPAEVKQALLDLYGQGQKWRQTEFAPMDEVYSRDGCAISFGKWLFFARTR
jgi:hypothetical protein